MKLTTQQIETFNRDGFFIARGALLESDLQPVIDELNELIETRANILFTQGKIDNLHKEAPFELISEGNRFTLWLLHSG